jgi:Flp pilus assembly protein TadG
MNVQSTREVRRARAGERGGTLIEFAITASVFFMMLVGIAAASHLFFTHNALDDATRRGARYAALQLNNAAADTAIKNMVVYGTPTIGADSKSLIRGLTVDNVFIDRADFGVGTGTVTVRIDNYTYSLVIPGITKTITMPEYRTTVTGECAGYGT